MRSLTTVDVGSQVTGYPTTGAAKLAVRVLVALPLLVAVVAGDPSAAQQRRGVSNANTTVGEAIRLGDEAHLGLRPLDALEHYVKLLDAQPDVYPALWRASREAVALAALAARADARTDWLTRAVRYATAAVDARPNGVDGHAWHAMSLWKMIQERGAGDRARRSVEVIDAAKRTLSLEPSNALAHLVLGEWNADVMRLSTITRWTIRRLVDEDVLDGASWETAEDHLQLAVAAAPQSLAAHLALGRMLLDSGDAERARDALRQVLERPSVEPVDPILKQRAQALLAQS